MNARVYLSGRIYLVVAVLIAAAMLLNACVPIPSPIPAPPKAGMANPASVNCADKGGQLKIEKDAQGGEVGICIFPDGSQCEEWAFMRGECKPGQKPVAPDATASSTANSVTGTITYRQRIALAPDAVILVALVEFSKQENTPPATVIVSQTIPAAGKQAPFPFELKYDPAKIDPKNTYAVQARITVGGELRWINTQTYNVLAGGAGTSVEVIVEQAQNAAPAISTTASSAWEETLRNGRYELPTMEPGVFQLKDGKVELRYGEGASQVYRVELIATATGDLTADGQEDAVVVLAWNGGGSGTFYRLVVVGNQGGTLQQVAVEPLGDRIQVKALKIQDGKISVDMLTAGALDPACCPTQRVMRSYRLEGSTLKVVS